MDDRIRDALRHASHDAHRLASIAGALDALNSAMPATIHPDADETGRRATNGLVELLEVMIERAEALASRLDNMSVGKLD